MRYRVWHRTTYTYSDEVEDSVGLFHLVPRALPGQRVHGHQVTVSPQPGDVDRDVDYFGNGATYFHVIEPHSTLVIEAASDIEVDPPRYDSDALAQPWENARPLLNGADPGAWQAVEYALRSPRVAHEPEAAAYAAASLTPGRPLGEAVTDLMQRIHADFAYDSTATTVTSTVADVLATRAGVCQDFAHLALACLRAHGVAARYVSGYLATQPPPGKQRVFGADASHAWLAVWMPGTDQWLAIDPTNDQWANDRYVTVAWGRDYGDVSPVKGIIFTEAKNSTLRVQVDVAPVADAPVPVVPTAG
ncbi:transglutaminase family protein [Microbacterium sp. zg.Y1090]|uniref:transglutaminase family protein n=1 Tax=Microbacterium TaxID=33882 RepID=UPI00214C0E4C|nr:MULTISPECIES: transglutaminase family protein [unclassified Microbacterium]MCR2813890.1 transglutaminase family protein [Microbacterium sp. zg.Y1084]MCR2819600.1 transglutaminase family protein [Microbacterium sp. zg.Y1090]MDL5487079.1 transglutaminase family protein [Microbacterium sp. zg-Y1211]WIM28154.1 transglutaminase family protein [Microbacterium sp. zg-Y1090]